MGGEKIRETKPFTIQLLQIIKKYFGVNLMKQVKNKAITGVGRGQKVEGTWVGEGTETGKGEHDHVFRWQARQEP